ncbi:hypothetical protein H310_12407 [Aphanomyces invadans]|uniref:Uncharacterized protein n=1 Tax=Aphanomyces invadans TaxID=157072 RepID=A0A024TI00_9STRA|nr:hypothetical protein H310_12407 [Aphanomyces invadans]ETV93624.1 hypothetical protein H310_12407 [Aphanomyces invadans]|eukprot:XP_008877665.1 hypothetical protein H310_12407 [Aphanomyces invadans]
MFKARLVQRQQPRLHGNPDVHMTSGAGSGRCYHADNPDDGGDRNAGVHTTLCYQYVAKPPWKRQRAVVGGRRVPYFKSQLQHVRQRRRTYLDHNGLSSIDEEPANACEACHSNTFSRLDHTKNITLTTNRCNVKLHRRWGAKPVDIRLC